MAGPVMKRCCQDNGAAADRYALGRGEPLMNAEAAFWARRWPLGHRIRRQPPPSRSVEVTSGWLSSIQARLMQGLAARAIDSSPGAKLALLLDSWELIESTEVDHHFLCPMRQPNDGPSPNRSTAKCREKPTTARPGWGVKSIAQLAAPQLGAAGIPPGSTEREKIGLQAESCC